MAADRTPDRSASVREAIVKYLDRNPAAADTLEGIQSIWLGGGVSRAEVERAIKALVAQGIVVPRPLPDGSILYAGAAKRT